MVGMLIDGKITENGVTLDVINPCDETVAAKVPDAQTGDVERAVAAAKRAFPVWRDTDPACPSSDNLRLMAV